MKKLPEGYEVERWPDGSERLIKPGERTLLHWDMDGTEEGYYEMYYVATASKEEIKEILAAMTAYLEGTNYEKTI